MLATRIVHARIESMLEKIYLGKAEPFGEVTDHWGKIEFQTKGFPPSPSFLVILHGHDCAFTFALVVQAPRICTFFSGF